ncbi:hypothetical protein H6F86_21565 [Phormidium sp. FACHB-592]|uniref:Uncharacterized protein n=1 Tax=Stenomitos frigidus AS-A4 TaxID=2933935 RepID=A0ABV0KFF3_9CYAN|nr:hypothetical protein [Phormidium sp. FACHB-592]MBD2076424.1 hypothetical protein [Phormidium sp. FACHB-592]
MSKAKVRNTLITAVICSVIVGNTPQASADLGTASDFVRDNWDAIVTNYWSPYWKQVWYGNLSSQETRDTRRQYQSRANGILLNRCIEKFDSTFLVSAGNKVLNRWQFSSRSASNGGTDCFIRFPNRMADEFERRLRK